EVFHVLRGKSFLIQLSHGRADITDELVTLPGKIIETGLARSIDIRVFRNVAAWLSFWRIDGHKSVTKKPGTAHCEFAAQRNSHVIIYPQRHDYSRAVANKTWAAGDATDPGAGE